MWYRSIPATFVAIAIAFLSVDEAAAQTPAHVGTYTLVEVGDAALPAVVEEDGECREELLSATLTVETDGTWLIDGQVRETCGQVVETEQDTEEGELTVQGSALVFGEADDVDDDADEADENDLDWEDLSVGTLQGGSLVIRLDDGETDLVFRR